MIEIKKQCDFSELYAELWSGAVDTVDTVIENQKANELMQLLEEIFYEPTEITQINDFLWFDSDYVYEQLEIYDLTDELSLSKFNDGIGENVFF